MTDPQAVAAPRTAAQEQARAAVVRFIPDSWDQESVANFLWRLDEYARAIEAEAAPSEPLRAALERLLSSTTVAPPVVAGHEWPARCWDCGFTTEDPDAYAGDDEEMIEPERLCQITGTFHRWVEAGVVRYIPADTLEVFRAALQVSASEATPPADFAEWMGEHWTIRGRLRADAAPPAPALDVERLAHAIQADIARRRPLESGQPLTAWSEVMRTAIVIAAKYARLSAAAAEGKERES